MKQEKKFFSLRRKLVLFVGILALITYTCSFVFIEYIRPTFFESTSSSLFQIVTYALGIVWSCVLAAVFSLIIVRPLQRLENSANEVAEGKIGIDVEMPKRCTMTLNHPYLQMICTIFCLMKFRKSRVGKKL